MEINRISYQILEESISLYLSFNDFGYENIIMRIIGNKSGNPTNIKEYLNNPTEDTCYKILIIIKHSIDDPYLSNEERMTESIKEADLKLDKITNQFLNKIPIIKNINPFKKDSYEDTENELIVEYDGTIITKSDLISYLVNIILEKQLEIIQEDYRNQDNEDQLCHKI